MASKDLDKLMGKLKKDKKPSKEQEDLKQDELEDDLDEEEDQEEDEDQEDDQEIQDEVADNDPDDVLSQEVALLQNDGVFRRELLMVLKDLVNVQKVTAQVLIDIKKKVFDEEDGKGK